MTNAKLWTCAWRQSSLRKKIAFAMHITLRVAAMCICSAPCKAFAKSESVAWIERADKIIVNNSSSKQLILWKAYHLLQKAVLGKTWSAVRSDLTDHGISYTEGNPAADPTYCRCLLKRDITLSGEKHVYELYFDILASAKNDRILSVEPHLVSQVNEPFLEFVKSHKPKENLALERAVNLTNAKAEATTYPFLQTIDISYQSLSRRNLNYECNGFIIELNIKDDNGLSKLIAYSTASGLDPCMDGTSKIKKSFIPRDTLIDELHNTPALPEVKYKPVLRKTS